MLGQKEVMGAEPQLVFFRMYITGATANNSNFVHTLRLVGDLVLIGDAFRAFSYLAMLPAQQMGDSQRNSIGTKPQSNKRAVLNVIDAKDCVFSTGKYLPSPFP